MNTIIPWIIPRLRITLRSSLCSKWIFCWSNLQSIYWLIDGLISMYLHWSFDWLIDWLLDDPSINWLIDCWMVHLIDWLIDSAPTFSWILFADCRRMFWDWSVKATTDLNSGLAPPRRCSFQHRPPPPGEYITRNSTVLLRTLTQFALAAPWNRPTSSYSATPSTWIWVATWESVILTHTARYVWEWIGSVNTLIV